MEMRLHRIAGTKLFANTLPTDQPSRAVHASFCFLCPDATDQEGELGFATSLTRKGAYAFVPAHTSSPFAQLVPALQQAVQDTGQAVLWMDAEWRNPVNRLSIRGGVTAQSVPLPCWNFDVLAENVPGQGSIGFELPAGAQVTFDDSGFTLTHADMRLVSHVYTQAERMQPEAGRLRLEAAPGPSCATLQGTLPPTLASQLLSRLTPQVRYGWRTGALVPRRAARILAAQAADHGGVGARFQLHRYTPAHASSWIALESRDAGARLLSELIDTDGHAVELKPANDAAVYFQTSRQGNAHASLKGQFAVLPSPAAGMASVAGALREVLVGSSGTEFFQLGKDGYDGLEFQPDGDAFLKFGTEAEDPSVTADLLTAWIAPCRTAAPASSVEAIGYSFVAQPQEQPLYGRRGVIGAMQQVHASTVLFDPAPTEVDPSVAMPCFPLRGLRRTDLADTQRLDLEVLAPVRGLRAAKSRATLVRARGVLRTMDGTGAQEWISTPHGLLVQVDEQNQWQAIKLGGGQGIGWQLTIDRPKVSGQPVERWALQEALSRPDVFVAITKRVLHGMPPPESPPFGSFRLAVEFNGWTLKTRFADMGSADAPLPEPGDPPAPPTDPATEPVLVVKLSKGPLRVMLGNVGRWQLPRLFNNDPSEASKGAVGALDRLEKLSRGISPMVDGTVPDAYKRIAPELVPYYKALYDRITHEDWTGVLVMNADNSLDDSPAQFAMLKEGVKDRDTFSVPVLGIDVNRVVPAAGGMTLRKTSAFAAIHYHAPEPLPEDEDSFDFKLRTLNAVFDNSELRTLRASMQLRLAEYFGAKGARKEAGDSRLLDILCCYEAKDAVNGKVEYVFRALGERRMSFEGNPLLKGLVITRIDVTSDRTAKGSETRFGFWGDLSFADKFAKVTGIKKIEYENAALIMGANRFDADIGNVRVEFDKGAGNSMLDGLLAKFPLKVSDMRWASMKTSLRLPDLGYTGLKLPDLGGFDAESFDFGIELDLNLGSMGKLFEAVSFLQAKVIVGWHDRRNPLQGFALGFRFEGGNGPLDIGINGVLRLTARDVSLRSYSTPPGIGIGLLDPQLEMMGYKVPNDPKDTLVAFMPNDGKELGWAWARPDTDVGPLKLTYFAIGQRMELVPEGAFSSDATLNSIIDASEKHLRPSTDSNGVARLPDVGKLYAANAGWGVVARGSIGAFNARFVFLDQLERYGLGLDIPNIAKVDVMYRKLSDNQGVFSAQIEPGFRTLEMGAATVTLPIVGFDAVTNGGWAINIGYHGNDFSRGTTVQVLPFIGSGGLRFGKLDWRSSYVLNGPHSTRGPLIKRLDLDPVVEMSLAARVGIGKEFREGVFAAGITLSIYGIFEGALGRPQDPDFPSGVPARYIKIAGTVGLLLEIFGAVNFSLISATVSIRVWVEVGITMETWAPVIFHAEAGVSVFVRFVIARFKVFGRRFEIAINFSFATRVRFTQRLPVTFDGTVPAIYKPYVDGDRISAPQFALAKPEGVAPLNWAAHTFGAPLHVPAAVSIEPMMSGTSPVLCPMLLASDLPGQPDGLGEFSVRLFLWALRLAIGVGPTNPMPATVSLKQLEVLKERVSPPKGLSLARWGAMPLHFAVLQEFMEQHLRIQLLPPQRLLAAQRAMLTKLNAAASVVADHQTPRGTPLPWFADIAIWAGPKGKADSELRDFRTTHSTKVDEAWEAAFFALLSESMPSYPEDEVQALKREMLAQGYVQITTGAKDALDAITEDWAAALVQGIVQQAIRIARRLGGAMTEKDADHPIDLASLEIALRVDSDGEGIPATHVAQHASTFLHHGLRVPALGGAGALALPEFLKTELPLADLKSMGDCILSFQPRTGFVGSWIVGKAELDDFNVTQAHQALDAAWVKLQSAPLALELAIEDDEIDLTTQPRRFVPDVLVPLGKFQAASAGLRMAAIPEALFALSQRRPNLLVTPRFENLKDPNDHTPCAARWYVRIALQLEKPTRDGLREVYALRGVDPRVRDIVRAMNSGSNENLVTRALLAFPTSSKPEEPIPFTYVEGSEAFFFVTNLSREPNPPQTLLAKEADPMPPTLAPLSSPGDVVRILWMASTVNAPGFNLAFSGKNPIDHLFDEATVASVGLVLELASQPAFLPIVDGLLIDAAHVPEGHAVALVTNAAELSTNTPDGQVAITVTRANPLYGIESIPDNDERNAPWLAARFELVDWRTPAGAVNLLGTATLSIERDNVVPVRTHMEDENRLSVTANVDEPATWPHRIAVPLSRIAHLTALRLAAAGSGSPSAEEDPYAFVGTDVASLVTVGLRDGAGHLLDESRLAVKWKGTHKILYRDPIFTLQELPGARAYWRLTIAGGEPVVRLALGWTNERLFGLEKPGPLPEQRRAALLAQYRRYLAMVRQGDFTAVAHARIGAGLAVTMDVKHALLAWLAEIAIFLERNPQETSWRVINAPTSAVPLPRDKLPTVTSVPLQIKVQVVFGREPSLCDQRLFQKEGTTELWSAVSHVTPGSLEKPADWTVWAADVKRAFGAAFSLLRHVDGHTEPSTKREPAAAVYLARRAMLAVPTLKAASASFFAPTPLAKALLSGSVEVEELAGPAARVEVKDADLNAVAARAATALEGLLSASAAEALCRDHAAHYPALAGAKRGFGSAMASRLRTVVKSGADITEQAWDKFRNASRGDIRTAFAPLAVVTVTLQQPAPNSKTFLWGALDLDEQRARSSGDAPQPPIYYSSVRMPLGSTGPAGSFDFLVRWTDPGLEPKAVVEGRMAFRPRYVEVQGEKDSDGYTPSDWYEIVWGDELGTSPDRVVTVEPRGGGQWAIPLPLRVIPPTPSILRHEFVGMPVLSAANLKDYLQKARDWTYRLSVLVPKEDHDTAHLAVHFDDGDAVRLLTANGLFDALAAFAHHEQTISGFTGRLSTGGTVTAREVEVITAVFQRIAVELAAEPLRLVAKMSSENTRRIQLNTRRNSAAGITDITWKVEPPQYERAVKAMLFALPPNDSAPETDYPPNATSTGLSRYQGSPAPFGGAAGLSPRRIELSALDIMVQGRAMPVLLAKRNEELLTGIETAPEFVFETPVVRAPGPLAPHLVHPRPFDVATGEPNAKYVLHWLETLRGGLIAGVAAGHFAADISARLKLPLMRDGSARDVYIFVPLPSIKGAALSATDWTALLAGNLLTVLARLSPKARDEGWLEIKAKVFSLDGMGSERPILSLEGLSVRLNMLSTQAALDDFFDSAKGASLSPSAPNSPEMVANHVFAQTRWLANDDPQTRQTRVTIAHFVMARGQSLLPVGPPPAADLATDSGRKAWVSSLSAAALALAPAASTSPYAALAVAPAAPGAAEPVPHARHWAMAMAPERLRRVAGPLPLTSGAPEEAGELYLWGLE
jgi:hypothetical protein